MMHTKGAFLAASDQELGCGAAAGLRGGVKHIVVVPHKLSGMKTLEGQLTPQAKWRRWQRSMTNRCLGGRAPGRGHFREGCCPPGRCEFSPELLLGQEVVRAHQ